MPSVRAGGDSMNRTNHHPYRRMIGIAIMLIGALILLTRACADQTDKPAMFTISGYGENIPGEPQEDVLLEYAVTLYNPSDHAFRIRSVEPYLPAAADAPVILEVRPAAGDERLGAGKEVEYTGMIRMNTGQLTKEAIKKLLPMIRLYRITFNNGEEVILSSVR